MAIYTFKCTSCGLEFEDFSKISDRLNSKPCKVCGAESARTMSNSFGVLTSESSGSTLYSPNEIDRSMGKKAEQKWEGYNESWKARYNKAQADRREGKELKEIPMQKESDGKYSPLLNLGDKKEQQKRREYSEILQQHRSERKKKGLGQFDGPGVIDSQGRR